jgi:Putative prokaryotic signal transducing protein
MMHASDTLSWRRAEGGEVVIAVDAYPTRIDAELAQAALAAEGIPSVIASDDAGGAYPFDLSGGARLLVAETDAEDAKAILATDGAE